MPSTDHEVLIKLFRGGPELLSEVMRAVFEMAVLSAMLHAGAGADFLDFSAGFVGAMALGGQRGTLYGDWVLNASGELEAQDSGGNYAYVARMGTKE